MYLAAKIQQLNKIDLDPEEAEQIWVRSPDLARLLPMYRGDPRP
jgi:hypothetical protein